jgi:glycosyltransferase involved in cell wall biosynthesis
MKIAAFTDHWHTPSSRFRIRQYIPIFERYGIYVHDYYRKFSTQTSAPPDGGKRIRESYSLIIKAIIHESKNIATRAHDVIESKKYDISWLSRHLIIGYPSFEWLVKKPLIYDIDDAVFLTGKLAKLQFKITTQQACAVIAGNDFLAEEASKYCKNISIIPTAVDTQRWIPLKKQEIELQTHNDEFIIGWSGTSSSFKYFLPLEKDIKKFIIDHPSAKLIFMADRFPRELKILSPHIDFIKWHINNEVGFIQSLDVGLMPIAQDTWSEGKCAYKSLLYSACGVPVVITPTGVNNKILIQAEIGFGPEKPEDWYEVLHLLFSDRTLGKRLGANGVSLIEKEYSVNACSPKIIEVFKKNIGLC